MRSTRWIPKPDLPPGRRCRNRAEFDRGMFFRARFELSSKKASPYGEAFRLLGNEQLLGERYFAFLTALSPAT